MGSTYNVGAWSYAVPLEETDGNARPFHHRDENATENEQRSLQKRSSAWDLVSDSEATKQRRTSLRTSGIAQQTARKRSRNQLRDTRQEEKSEARVDDSAWIHRDKLAQIEIQEMQEAGIYVRKSRRSDSTGPLQGEERASRSASRSGIRRPSSRSRVEPPGEPVYQDEDYAAAYPSHAEPPRKRVSTVPSAPEDELELAQDPDAELDQHFHAQPYLVQPSMPDYDPYRDASPRSYGGSAAEQQQSGRQQLSRPSTSRIPVSRVSPVPVPQTVVDRDSPLPRSRAGSQNWSGSFEEMQYHRKLRSGSVSSQVLLDSDPSATRQIYSDGPNKTIHADENSLSKQRGPKKAGTGETKSTDNRPSSSHKQGKRALSTSTSRRPGSSSGHKSRPSTGNTAPEGEAPWIATMYKPDPRLPPDQQMLPTHAKRMMQEQWERDGKTGTAYDRDFRLLNDEELPQPHDQPLAFENRNFEPLPRNPSPTKRDLPSPNGSSPGPWSASPTKGDTRSEHNGRPGTSGGYKITPTITQTPTMQRSPIPSPAPVPNGAMQQMAPRLPELDEKQEAAPKKGCCCVVM